MSSFDKVVKMACKPKPAPPKAKYLDPIIAATWSEDGAVHDVCKALVPRLREPNAIIVFKALIVLHIMIRNGATDNVLSHLSSSEVLRLRNVSAGNWEGYNAPQNMQHYALYLDSRIRAYRELQHDAIRVQAESNRDLRLNNSIEEDMAYTTVPPPKASSTKSKTPQRSKTIMGRKLRLMTVEKGLLRETKTVQKMIDALVECRFYLDDLEDELTITALRMLVKDLLILFQAGNEGVINVLEHYFEMSKYDAEEALGIYRNFCDQTERVVEYLGVAKKLQNLLNVPIPNLKHAPVSLASSLQDYLSDPNFEQNRLEYKASKAAKNRDGPPSGPASSSANAILAKPTITETSIKPPSPPPAEANRKSVSNHTTTDFFNSIEEPTPVFNSPTASPTNNQFQQPPVHNPFVQRQITGALLSQSFGAPIPMHSTGAPASMPFQSVQPFQPTQSLPSSQNINFSMESQQAPQHRPFSTFIPQQPTGFQSGPTAGFIQPQTTGVNPFRQSVLVPQTTGMIAFNSNGIPPMPPLPAPQIHIPFQATSNLQSQPPGSLIAQPGQVRQPGDVPARPASTPLTGIPTHPSSASPPIAQPVKSHQTGSRNPFGAPVIPTPPIPKPPTLAELSLGLGRFGVDGSQPPSQSQSAIANNPPLRNITATTTESTLSTVASSFAFTSKPEEAPASFGSDFGSSNSSQFTTTTTGSSATDSFFSSPFSSQVTGSISSTRSIPMTAPIKPQLTGFGGVKPFKPTSSFGASLLESLPPIPQSGATTPDRLASAQTTMHSNPALPTNPTLNGSDFPSKGIDSNVLGTVNSQPTGVNHSFQGSTVGPTIGVGLRPQATGALGAANPFRATMFTATSAPPSVPSTLASSVSTPSFAGVNTGMSHPPVFNSGAAYGSPFPFSYIGQDQNTQQQNVGPSLI